MKALKFWERHDLLWADGTIFMTRYTLLKRNALSIKIHRFRRSDEEMHDHPWAFFSLVLWRGYVEETPNGPVPSGLLIPPLPSSALAAQGMCREGARRVDALPDFRATARVGILERRRVDSA
jgi:hypothetical protein